MPSLDEIRTSVSARVAELRPAVDEYQQLAAALAALGSLEPSEDVPGAPYGYKADGTPRKRPGRKAPAAV